MGSKYGVIQFMPDVVSEEVINIGLVAFDEHENLYDVMFLTKWDRVRTFATYEPILLLDFVRECLANRPALEIRIRQVMKRFGTIRITPLRSSTLAPEKILDDIAPLFLKNA